MAIKVGGTIVVDDSRNLANLTNAVFSGTSHVKLPSGTIAQRPGSAAAGMIRFNSEEDGFEGYTSEGWGALGGGGGGFLPITLFSGTTEYIGTNSDSTLTIFGRSANTTIALAALIV
jgi:hypothetical protein